MCICIYIYVNMGMCVYTCMNICTYRYVYMYILRGIVLGLFDAHQRVIDPGTVVYCAGVYACLFTCIYIYIYVCMNVCICMYILRGIVWGCLMRIKGWQIQGLWFLV
jgi:hypothetical protein